MDNYKTLMCIKGLIMSLDEQLTQLFQKDNLPNNVKNKIVNEYYDAILKQLAECKCDMKVTQGEEDNKGTE